MWTDPVDRRSGSADAPSRPGGAWSDTSGGDDINAHVSGGFLRVFLVIGVVAALGAAACLLAGAVALRRIGPSYRIARLLAAAPMATLEEVARLAEGPERRYVRARGRITSDEEFPDEHERPLVFRRQRVETAEGHRWRPLQEERLAVPFGIEDRTRFIAVDVDALGEGLVVIPREATGTAAELPGSLRGELGTTLPADAAVRLRVDQVSAVEHATVCGVAQMGPTGPTLTAGLGRPLVLSTLEPAAAMRVLAGDQRRTAVSAAMCLVAGLGLVAFAIMAFVAGW